MQEFEPPLSPLARVRTSVYPAVDDISRTPIYRVLGAMYLFYTGLAFVVFRLKGIALTPDTYCNILIPPIAIPLFAVLYSSWPQGLQNRLSRLYRREFAAPGCFLIGLALSFHSVFQAFKMSFTYFVPFYLDEWLSGMDQRMFFGHIPWHWIEGLYSNHVVIHATDIFYTLWLIIDVVVLIWQAFAPKNNELRAIYFLSYFLVWMVLGTAIAIAGSSAGPCYFHYISRLPDPYAEQMQYLNNVGRLGAVTFQKMLWENYVAGNGGLVNGISAFPSVHVAMACVFFLLSLHYGRVAKIVGGLFFIIILFGSVALAWHYAVDGCFSVVATVMLWYFSTAVVRRFKLSEARQRVSAS